MGCPLVAQAYSSTQLKGRQANCNYEPSQKNQTFKLSFKEESVCSPY